MSLVWDSLGDDHLSLQWSAWRDRGLDHWEVEVLQVGYCIPFVSYSSNSTIERAAT